MKTVKELKEQTMKDYDELFVPGLFVKDYTKVILFGWIIHDLGAYIFQKGGADLIKNYKKHIGLRLSQANEELQNSKDKLPSTKLTKNTRGVMLSQTSLHLDYLESTGKIEQ